MLVTLFGMVTEVRPLQFRKARSPIFVTLLGIIMFSRLRHPSNAQYPMLVTPSGIVIVVIDVRVSNCASLIPLFIFEKACSPISVTASLPILSGMTTFVSISLYDVIVRPSSFFLKLHLFFNLQVAFLQVY